MTHDEQVQNVFDNIKARNEVFSSLYNSLEELLRPMENKSTNYVDVLMQYAKKHKRSVKSLYAEVGYYDNVVHNAAGIRYCHRSYGPEMNKYSISLKPKEVYFSREADSRGNINHFAFPLDEYKTEILKEGIPILTEYQTMMKKINGQEERNSKERYFEADGNRYRIEISRRSYYSMHKFDRIELVINDKSYLLSRKELNTDKPLTESNCFFNIKETQEAEQIIMNFIPLLKNEVVKGMEEVISAEERVKEFLAPHLVLRALKNK